MSTQTQERNAGSISLIVSSDICSDGEEFANSFGQILTARTDAYRLAAAVLYELSRRFLLTGFDAKASINPNAFLGIHLRTSSDAVKVIRTQRSIIF